MILKLYKTLDAKNVINKTLDNELELNVKMQGDLDVNNPMIAISKRDFDYNYCHIPEIGRYYFIDEVRKGAVISLSCSCDYLETYKSQIMAGEALFSRAVKAGDYGNVNLDLTGREDMTLFFSDVALEESEGAVLSVILGESE